MREVLLSNEREIRKYHIIDGKVNLTNVIALLKRPRRETNHSPPSITEVKNSWHYISTPPIRFHGVVLG